MPRPSRSGPTRRRLADELAFLIRRINRTNATTAFDDARTVTDELARTYRELDTSIQELNWSAELAD